MAGVLQTGTFVNGQWRSQRLDINTVLQRNESKQASEQPQPDKPQAYGLLSQTVIESPIVRWILPVNIRGSDGDRDVAFISDNAVQIRYLDEKDQFLDIARKADFRSRIRNARIVGSVASGTKSTDPPSSPSHDRANSEDEQMEDVWAPKSVEYIVLALENGTIVFLFARTEDGEVELVPFTCTVSRSMLPEQPGRHLAVDPSSRYMAVAGVENVFAVYELQSIDALKQQPSKGLVFPVKSERYFHVDGVIHKMEFLYPRADDPAHIILLLLVVSRATTRMFVYDWVAGQRLQEIRSNFKRGTTVVRQYGMPLLLIPLRIRSAVLFVSEKTMIVCRGVLEGIPKYTEMDIKSVKISPRYIRNGPNIPLWTSWFRPLRHQRYSMYSDDLYLAREDGAVLFMENNTELILQAQMDMYVDCNIDTAFACLDKASNQKHGDRLVVGGDSCNGGLYLIEARHSPVLLSRMPNWSPVVDFVVTNEPRRHGVGTANQFGSTGLTELAKPDRIFTLTGRGTGYGNALSEMRYGHEAYLLVESDLDLPIDDAWYLPFDWIQPSHADHNPSTLMLLSTGNQSSLLYLAADESTIEQVEPHRTWLDLTSRTITATACRGLIIQVTKKCVTISPQSALDASPKTIYRKEYPVDCPILAAFTYENELVLTVHKDKSGSFLLSAMLIRFEIQGDLVRQPMIECIESSTPISTFPNIVHVLKLEGGRIYDVLWDPKLRLSERAKSEIDGKNLNKDPYYGLWDDGFGLKPEYGSSLNSLVNIFRVLVGPKSITIDAKHCVHNHRSSSPLSTALASACISLVSLGCYQDVTGWAKLLLAGHRDGVLVMVYCTLHSEGYFVIFNLSRYNIGSTAVSVKLDSRNPNAAFICCDSKLWRVVFDHRLNSDPVLSRVWFTDIDDPYILQPHVNKVCLSQQRILLIGGSKILVAVLDPDARARAVPRPIPLSGQASRFVSDETLGFLVTVVKSGSDPLKNKMLALLDPESALEVKISWPQQAPTSTQKSRMRSSSPLISAEETVLSMCAIPDSDSLGSSVIIVGLKNKIKGGGGLNVYYLSKGSLPSMSNIASKDDIVCTSYEQFGYRRPVYAIAALNRTVIFCMGDEIHCVGLRTNDLKAECTSRKILELPSSAVSISITSSHQLNVHTAKHSLLTYKFDANIGDLWDEIDLTWAPYFADELDRDGLDHIVLSNNTVNATDVVVMVSDKACSVVGLSHNQHLETLAQNQHTLFEGELSASILKFGRGNTRPPWDVSWTEANSRDKMDIGDVFNKRRALSTTQNARQSLTSDTTWKGPELEEEIDLSLDGAETLGVTIDGSLRHFTVLPENVWKVLYSLQHYARRLENPSSFTEYQPIYWRSEPDPLIKHIDGDYLRKYLRSGHLEHLFTQIHEQNLLDEVLYSVGHFSILFQDGWHGELQSHEMLNCMRYSINELYRLLEILLRPVL